MSYDKYTICSRSRENSSVLALVGFRDRDSVAKYFIEKFDEEFIKAFQLFEYNNDAIGWLVRTKTRLIFYINQNINNFKDMDLIKWKIDNLKNIDTEIKFLDENEIQILPGKNIVFDPNLISKERLLSEIKKLVDNETESKGDTYKQIHTCAINASKKTLNKAEEIGYISSSDKLDIFNQLKDIFLKKMINSSLSPSKFLDIVDNSINLSLNDIAEAEKISYVSSSNKIQLFFDKFGDHLNSILKIKIKNSELEEVQSETKMIKPKELFLSIPGLDNFYQRLIKEINETFYNTTYTSTLILCRKLIENLLIDVLRKKYGDKTKEIVEIYYNTSAKRFHSFTYLVKNLEDRKDDFEVDKEIVNEFISLAKPFRAGANSKAHSMIFFIDKKEELVEYHIPRMIDLLIKLLYNLS